MKRAGIIVLLVILTVFVSSVVSAVDTPIAQLLYYHKTMPSDSTMGTYPAVFKLYNSASGGNVEWREPATGTMDITLEQDEITSEKYFDHLLGNIVALSSIKFDKQYWLEVTYNGVTYPREMFLAVPYSLEAVHAATAENLTNWGPGSGLDADSVDGLHAADLVGAQGPAGPMGPQGPQGIQGEPGPSAEK